MKSKDKNLVLGLGILGALGVGIYALSKKKTPSGTGGSTAGYNCVNGSCQSVSSGATYSTLAQCQANCTSGTTTCSTAGTLTFNGKTYCMKWALIPSGFTQHSIGMGTLVVNQSGSGFNGTYNTHVYLFNNYLYVWPQAQFSMVSTTTYS